LSDVDAYKWIVGEPPPTLHVHSLAKHSVLEAYLTRYVEVLTIDPRIDVLRLDIVDGMSGGGQYTRADNGDICDGSPLIFLRALRAVEAKLNLVRRKEFRIDCRFFFVDKNPDNISYLKMLISQSEFSKELGESIICIDGDFQSHSDKLIKLISQKTKGGRSIFLLDQYGYKDVPLNLLRRIFSSLPRAEILLTFGTDALIQYLNDSEEYRKILSNLGIGPDLLSDLANSRHVKMWRYLVQSHLSRSLSANSGADYFTPFFIRSRESNRAYWFIHLSKHAKARDEMVKVHWLHHNNFIHYGGAGLHMLGYDPASDDELTNQPAFEFDSSAKETSINTMLEDLVRIVHSREEMSFELLIEETANDSPATSEMFKSTLGELSIQGDIKIITPKGQERRSSAQISNQDLIVAEKQTFFDFKKR